MALFPPDRLRNGHNDVQVFVVDPAQPTRLVRTRVRRSLPASLNLVLDGAAKWGVALRSFYPMESAGGTSFRWTREESTILAPLGPGRSPARLSVDILFAGAEKNRLRIMLNDCELISETPQADRWTKTIDLAPCKPHQLNSTIDG